MKVGVIYTCFNAENLLPMSLPPWVEARATKLGGHDYVICAVSVPFEAFGEEATDRTRSILGEALNEWTIDHAIVRDKPMKETEARGLALRWLVEQGVDITFQADADERYVAAEIERILAFVAARPGIAWFRGSLRNAVFDAHTFLVEPFTPPRIHRVHLPGGYVADGFWDDNNVRYTRPWEREKMSCPVLMDTQLPHLTIPKSAAWVKHFSWLNDSRSRKKVAYQEARKWRCDFAWDESRGGLVWRDPANAPETERD